MSAKVAEYGCCFPTRMTESGLQIKIGEDSYIVKLPAMKWASWLPDDSYIRNSNIFVYSKDIYDNTLILRRDGTGTVYNKARGILYTFIYKIPAFMAGMNEVKKGVLRTLDNIDYRMSTAVCGQYCMVMKDSAFGDAGITMLIPIKYKKQLGYCYELPIEKLPIVSIIDEENCSLVYEEGIGDILINYIMCKNSKEVFLE